MKGSFADSHMRLEVGLTNHFPAYEEGIADLEYARRKVDGRERQRKESCRRGKQSFLYMPAESLMSIIPTALNLPA
jgi:hypothetical protein